MTYVRPGTIEHNRGQASSALWNEAMLAVSLNVKLVRLIILDLSRVKIDLLLPQKMRARPLRFQSARRRVAVYRLPCYYPPL
jgi:hypothetical protein